VFLLSTEISFAAESYVVRSGESLYLIARKYHTSVSTLQRINSLQPDGAIKIGQVLSVPSATTQRVTSGSRVYGYSRRRSVQVWSDNELVATVRKSTQFQVLYRDDDKYKVKLSDGRTGWVEADDVTLHDTRQAQAVGDRWSKYEKVGHRMAFHRTVDDSSDTDLVHAALACRGASYRFGGLSSRGFDCSGFVKYLYASKGIKLPHSSRAQFCCGKPVSESELKPGDVVFFSGTYRAGVSHVGLYVGGGRFIHASTENSGVCVDRLDADYYRRRYAGARRIR
jgi:cell wall-associated NlpC family hydrolase